MRFVSWLVLPVFLLMGLVGASTCSAEDEEPFSAKKEVPTGLDPGLSRISLRFDLDGLSRYIQQTMEESTKRIREESADKKVQASASEWQKYFLKLVSAALSNEDSLVALLDTWALARRGQDYLENEGKDRFKQQQKIAVLAASRIAESTRALAEEYLTEEKFAEARQGIEAYVKEKPLKKSFFSGLFDVRKQFFSAMDVGKRAIGSVAAVPLLPQRAGQGIVESAEQMRSFNETAARFTEVVQSLPAEIRLEIEKTMETLIANQPELSALLADIERATANLAVASKNAEALSVQAHSVVESAHEASPDLTKLAEAVGAAVDEMSSLTLLVSRRTDGRRGSSAPAGARGTPSLNPKDYQEAAQAIEAASTQLTQFMVEIQALVAQARSKPEGEAEEERSHPFDVREYAEAAVAIEAGTAELRGALADFEGFMRGDSATTATLAFENALSRTEQRSKTLIDYLFSRLVLLAVIVFLLAIAYRFLVFRLQAGHGKKQGR